jgi:hypothetical protein
VIPHRDGGTAKETCGDHGTGEAFDFCNGSRYKIAKSLYETIYYELGFIFHTEDEVVHH